MFYDNVFTINEPLFRGRSQFSFAFYVKVEAGVMVQLIPLFSKGSVVPLFTKKIYLIHIDGLLKLSALSKETCSFRWDH